MALGTTLAEVVGSPGPRGRRTLRPKPRVSLVPSPPPGSLARTWGRRKSCGTAKLMSAPFGGPAELPFNTADRPSIPIASASPKDDGHHLETPFLPRPACGTTMKFPTFDKCAGARHCGADPRSLHPPKYLGALAWERLPPVPGLCALVGGLRRPVSGPKLHGGYFGLSRSGRDAGHGRHAPCGMAVPSGTKRGVQGPGL